MLQATADAAALAGAIELPKGPEARATAVFYAQDNMAPQVNGKVLDVRDVHVGKWDPGTQTLDKSVAEPDTVMVTTWRGEENTNPLPVTFLKLLGLEAWNVRTQAAAQRYIPECLRDGLIARRHVQIKSDNNFLNRICVYGKKGVHVSSDNYFEPGVNVSMYDLDTLLLPNSGFESNIGLKDALRESGLDPRMVDHVDEIMNSFLDPETSPYLPDYIAAPSQPVIEVQRKDVDKDTFEPGRVYRVRCDEPTQSIEFPGSTVIHDVVIVADCRVTFHANVHMYNVALASRNGGDGDITKTNIEVNAETTFSADDDCAEGGGVQLFSNASMYFNAKTTFHGVQMVAAGNIELNAKEQGINGISAQAGIDIPLTSENAFGLCDGGAPDLFTVPYYRIVL